MGPADIAWGQICILVCQIVELMKDIHEIPNTGAPEDQIKNEDEKKTEKILFTQICDLNN